MWLLKYVSYFLLSAIVVACNSEIPPDLPEPIRETNLESTATSADDQCTTEDEDEADIREVLNEFSLSREQFLAHYCDGVGVGEIKQAYRIAAENEIEVDVIFVMFNKGMGWGDIRAEFNVGDAEEGEGEVCKDEHQNHPEIGRIADDFSVPQGQVADLFCGGLGFGEIRNAYLVRLEVPDSDLDEIVALFLETRNWNTVRERFGAPLLDDPTGND